MKRDTMDEVHHSMSHKMGDVPERLTFHVQALWFIGTKQKTEVQGGVTQFTIKKHGFS